MIERTNIKEAFGGEVPFTNYIAATASVKDRLLEVLELEPGDNLKILMGDQGTIILEKIDGKE